MIRTGVDLIEVDRIDRAILRHGDRFFERFFTVRELVEASGHTPALAARFSAKEAVAKALGTGIGDVGWKDIEITKGSSNRRARRHHPTSTEDRCPIPTKERRAGSPPIQTVSL